jgi:4-aminobutyrate aminotransferase
MGACLTKEKVMDWSEGSHENTLGGNPIIVTAALAVLKVIRDEKLEHNSKMIGQYLMKRLREMQKSYEIIGDLRGKGLMIGIELVKNTKTKVPATQERDTLIKEAFKRGLLILGAGSSSLRLAPPLILTKQQADVSIEILEESLRASI